MNINIDYYKTFYHAAKELNYTRAAEKLFVSQSSVSQSIRTLEDHLGAKLFYRNGKSMELTEEGKALYSYVSGGINLIEQGEKAVKDIISLDIGEVKIGISDTLSRYYLIDHLRSFYKLHPKVKIKINNRPSTITVNMVEAGTLDLGIINLNPTYPYEKLDVTVLAKSETVIIASEELIGSNAKQMTLKEILKYPIITLEKNSTTRKMFDKYLTKLGYSFEPEMEFGSIDNIVEMVRLGVGIGFISRMPGQDLELIDGIKIIKTKEELPEIKIGLITNKTIPMSKASRRFVGELLQEPS